MKTWIVRTNCEYSQQVILPDDSTEDDAIAEASKTDVASWDQAWAPMEAEEECDYDEEKLLVSRAADALTRVYGPQWPGWVRLWRLSMTHMRMCVLAQVEIGSGLSPVYDDDKLPFTAGLARLYRANVSGETTHGFVLRVGESIGQRRRAWKREIRRRRRETP